MPILIQPSPRIDLCDITTDASGRMRATISRPWSAYFDKLFERVGGKVAPVSPDELAQQATAAALGVFGKQATPAQEPPDIRYVGAFMPRMTPSVSAPEDANSVICGRVFARR